LEELALTLGAHVEPAADPGSEFSRRARLARLIGRSVPAILEVVVVRVGLGHRRITGRNRSP
jgi:hypothetical protein